jgi:alpha-D-xyloside xylohydrolase
MDIGGFCVENRYVAGQNVWNYTGKENADMKEWRELNTRWFQFGAFCPLFRAHGQYPFREPWEIAPEGHPAYESIVYYTKLRYSLMPYIYSLAGKTYFDDYTIMRPLVMDFMADAKVLNIGDQYMFGPAFLVAPVYEYGAREREVYFPECEGWYEFGSNKFVEGGITRTFDAPYGRMPLYVRAGSVVPFGPDIQWSDEKPADVIDLYVYQGADGAFTLYEDENVNYNYEKGAYAMIDFYYDDSMRLLSIGEYKGGDFPGKLEERTFNIIPVSKDGIGKAKTVKYNGLAMKVVL